jgi:hypothetical protein
MTTPQLADAQLAFKKDLEKVIIELQAMLISKNIQYGDSALNPVQVFSRSSALELIRVRIDDKLARIRNGDTSEDASWDLMGYLVLERIAMNRQAAYDKSDAGIRANIVNTVKHLPIGTNGPEFYIPAHVAEGPSGPETDEPAPYMPLGPTPRPAPIPTPCAAPPPRPSHEHPVYGGPR